MLDLINKENVNRLSLSNHFMIEIPACATSKLSDNNVAISQEVDIEVNVMNGLKHNQLEVRKEGFMDSHLAKCKFGGCLVAGSLGFLKPVQPSCSSPSR